MIGTGDVAGTAGTSAKARRGRDHGADDFRMLPHAEIIVRAPDHDVARAGGRMPNRMRETTGDAFEIREHPISPLFLQPTERGGEERVIVHARLSANDARMIEQMNS